MNISDLYTLAGNSEQYSVENTKTLPVNALTGKKVIFLGSSVTYGAASLGESFVDFMVKRDGITAVKEAVSGTVLVDEMSQGQDSYITRMKRIDQNFQADAFICQLSTNDATQMKPLGEIGNQDVHTVAGAIEYIISYAKDTWHCPVLFYTECKYESSAYAAMVDLLADIKEKHDIGIIDLWHDEKLNAISEEQRNLYMADAIHPTRAGYLLWWTPVFENYLLNFFEKNV